MKTLRTVHVFIDHRHRFSLGTERDGTQRVLGVQIAAGIVDYEVQELLAEADYQALLADPDAAIVRAEALRSAHEAEAMVQHLARWKAAADAERAQGIDPGS